MNEADALRALRGDDPTAAARAAEALWTMWHRSGNSAIDKLLYDGIVAMQANKHAEAEGIFTGIITQAPDFAEGWNKRATALFLAGAYRRSLADCDEVLKRNPQHFGALSGYGQIYSQPGEYARAIEWWRRALQVNPNLLDVEIGIRRAEELLREKRGRST